MRLRILITIVALFGYEARQFDVLVAYLGGEADSGATPWRRAQPNLTLQRVERQP